MYQHHFGANVGTYFRKISNGPFLEFLFSHENRYLVSGQICQFLQGLRFGVTTPTQVFLDCRAVGTDETIASTPIFRQIRYPYFNLMAGGEQIMSTLVIVILPPPPDFQSFRWPWNCINFCKFATNTHQVQ